MNYDLGAVVPGDRHDLEKVPGGIRPEIEHLAIVFLCGNQSVVDGVLDVVVTDTVLASRLVDVHAPRIVSRNSTSPGHRAFAKFRAVPGSPPVASNDPQAGVEGLMRALVDQAEFVASQTAAEEVFTQLTSRDEEHRNWRLARGLRHRPIHRGEASCTGVALRTGFGFATDDGDGAAAYQSLAGRPAESTHSLMKDAVEQQLLPDAQARVDWEHLNLSSDCAGVSISTGDISYEPFYPMIKSTMLARLANWPGGQGTESTFTAALDLPRLIVRHVLGLFEGRGLIRQSKAMGPQGWCFYNVSPLVRRLADTDS